MNQPTNPAGAADVHDSVVIERTFDAPIDLVWRMWTDGTEFAKWYGPPGATIPVADIDARVGGRRRVCMEVTTPDGEKGFMPVLSAGQAGRLKKGEALTVGAPGGGVITIVPPDDSTKKTK